MNWEQRYRSGNTPWDLGQAHPELVRRLEDGWLPSSSGRVFVPGCGTGHDALAFCRVGWQVTAMDIVDATDGRLDEELHRNGGECLIGDALTHRETNGYELIWDHTFFCAIDPGLRLSWFAMVSRLTSMGADLAGISFPEDRPADADGPPWRMTVGSIAPHLGDFELVEEAVPEITVERRKGREHWYRFTRI